MKRSKKKAVQEFLNGVMMSDPEKYDSLNEMRQMVFNLFPKAGERIMYGGIMFSMNEEDFCGLFVRKNHISFEFSNGSLMKDRNKYLEGTGKFRRHLKIRSNSDIKEKEVVSFIKQVK